MGLEVASHLKPPQNCVVRFYPFGTKLHVSFDYNLGDEFPQIETQVDYNAPVRVKLDEPNTLHKPGEHLRLSGTIPCKEPGTYRVRLRTAFVNGPVSRWVVSDPIELSEDSTKATPMLVTRFTLEGEQAEADPPVTPKDLEVGDVFSISHSNGKLAYLRKTEDGYVPFHPKWSTGADEGVYTIRLRQTQGKWGWTVARGDDHRCGKQNFRTLYSALDSLKVHVTKEIGKRRPEPPLGTIVTGPDEREMTLTKDGWEWILPDGTLSAGEPA